MEKNYLLEENIDFYAELYKSLDEPDSETDENTDENKICLITNKKLEDKYVKLGCGHTFNYIPLYNDILNHKTKFNQMESSNNRLKFDEIRCPYCRYKQQGLLPYYENLGLKMVYGVNSYDLKYYSNSSNFACSYPECDRRGCRIFMNKRYCTVHAWQVKKEIASKKQEEKEAKLKAKEEEKQKKLEEKQKKLEEKQKKFEEKQKKLEEKQNTAKPKIVKKNKVENTIIDENLVVLPDNTEIIDVNNDCCNVIIKSGTRKGMLCGVGIYKENMCKRHFTITNK